MTSSPPTPPIKPAATIIDTHCHLDFESFNNDRNQVIQRATAHNVSDIIIPGTQKIYWDRIKKLCTSNSQLHACYGLHPYWLGSENKQAIEDLDSYVENCFIENNHPVAIGECGLDFRPQQADKQTQLYFFDAQLNIAQNRNLPVVIHSVKATETVIRMIKKYKNLRGMVHSYSGSAEQAGQLIDLNFCISISGSVTYDNAKKIKNVVREIPLKSLLMETDAPDQIDMYNSNNNSIESRNEPAYLINTLTAISALRGVSIETIAEQTTINAKTLFGI